MIIVTVGRKTGKDKNVRLTKMDKNIRVGLEKKRKDIPFVT